MGIEDIFVWYQQKIGTYDKQQWETRIERVEQIYGLKCHGRGLGYGLSHVQMRTTKPNTELIDLDLATGSSFTKAKPQHGFFKVARLATFRCLLFPFYGKWWINQTSQSVFFFVLVIYVAQVVNLFIFHRYGLPNSSDSEGISWMEVTIPLVIMWILSLIHSQIVATTPSLEDKMLDAKSKKFNSSSSRRRSNLRQSRRMEKVKIGRKGEKILKKLKFKDTVPEQGSSGVFKRSHLNLRHSKAINIDDGFESLNGNGSRTSEEEIVPTKASQSSLNADTPQNASLPLEVENLQQLNETKETDENKAELNNRTSTPANTPPRHSTPPFLPQWKKRAYLKKSKETTTDCSEAEAEDETEENSSEKLNLASKRSCELTNNKSNKDSECVSKVQNELTVKRIVNKVADCNTDSESDVESTYNFQTELSKRHSHVPVISVTSTLDSTCDTEDEPLTSPETRLTGALLNEVGKNSTEWIGVTTNSEDCSYSSDMDDVSEAHADLNHQDCFFFDNDLAPTSILNPPSVRASCIIWGHDEIKEADLSMLDISLSIIAKVESMPASMDYFYVGMVFATVLAFLPIICRLSSASSEYNSTEPYFVTEIYRNVTGHLLTGDVFDLYRNIIEKFPQRFDGFLDVALSSHKWERIMVVIATAQRWILASMVFFLLSVAERTFKQRFLYAKLFSHLTSSRRARKSELPHFRLNKVRNIKTWLSVRSYLKRRGPQRSVDVIVSTAFIVTLLLLTFLCVELLKDTVSLSQYYLEALIWSLGLGVLLLRFMTLGTKINKKYRNLSVLITEQINLHLQMEQKPHKKDELTVANNVLKLAIDLLKELENPFKISGLSANPILYNVTKLVILSALSGVLSEMLGFKLKLHKIKLK